MFRVFKEHFLSVSLRLVRRIPHQLMLQNTYCAREGVILGTVQERHEGGRQEIKWQYHPRTTDYFKKVPFRSVKHPNLNLLNKTVAFSKEHCKQRIKNKENFKKVEIKTGKNIREPVTQT